MKKSFLFPQLPGEMSVSFFLFALRLVLGILLMTHGLDKWQHLTELSTTFPDPFGIGSQYSVLLAIFGELVCAAAFIVGFLYRLAMIPMIITHGFAFFMVHDGNINEGELALLYFSIFILMYFVGPGRFSIDYLFAKRKGNRGRGSRR